MELLHVQGGDSDCLEVGNNITIAGDPNIYRLAEYVSDGNIKGWRLEIISRADPQNS